MSKAKKNRKIIDDDGPPYNHPNGNSKQIADANNQLNNENNNNNNSNDRESRNRNRRKQKPDLFGNDEEHAGVAPISNK